MTKSNNSQSGVLDLSSIFNLATQALTANQSSLNEADTHNQDHGDNIVQAFGMISQALSNKKDASPSEQLMYASQHLA